MAIFRYLVSEVIKDSKGDLVPFFDFEMRSLSGITNNLKIITDDIEVEVGVFHRPQSPSDTDLITIN